MVSPTSAQLPPVGLPGLDPAWSRVVSGLDSDGVSRSWHVLDTHPEQTSGVEVTLLCVHGNPTWSYLWRRLVAAAPEHIRVVAIDQLDMGYSERTGMVRPLAQRVADLDAVADALKIDGPVITVAHDWGGPISLGWALKHRDVLKGVVLLNTAVHQPTDARAPSVIRLARLSGVRSAVTVSTPTFIRSTTALSGRRMPREVAKAYAAPYSTSARRQAIGDFVADIPLESEHVSSSDLDAIAEGIRHLDVPALLLWGPGDPVFSDIYLHDIQARMPHADVHRYAGARHLVIEDAPTLVEDLLRWVQDRIDRAASDGDGTPASVAHTDRHTERQMWTELQSRAAASPSAIVLAEPIDGAWRQVTWQSMNQTVRDLAAGLAARGVRRGDRVSVLVKPGADLIAVVYACWRIGASVVVTDAGLGVRGMARALRSAAPDHIIAIPRGMALVRASALRVPGQRIKVADLPAIAALGATMPLPDEPGPDDEALVAFTSGSTGPAKGVVYLHRQLQQTRDVLREHYSIADGDALVAAFAPWAVLGPALGIASAIPDMDVTSPRTLTATAVADATAVVAGTLMWASPAAFGSILRTAPELSDAQLTALQGLRLVLGAGAPVDVSLLHGMARLCAQAQVRTPYGMTEVLPVTDVTLDEIDLSGTERGVLVGHPLPGVAVRISAVDSRGVADGPLTDTPDVLGEVVVSAGHRKERYDRLWATERASSRNPGWHRTGDVGELDERGRLWIGGRLAHVITTAQGPLAPVAIEQAVQRLPGIAQAACVGVGPLGTQQVVLVCVAEDGGTGLASLDMLDGVRAVTDVPVAAVLLRASLPVDIRHNSKIDRSALAEWASTILAGHR